MHLLGDDMNYSMSDVENIKVSEGQVTQVRLRMTPIEIRHQTDFQAAFQIRTELFKTFDELYMHREKIQHLIMLPIKEPKLRTDYSKLDKQKLAQDIISKMGDSHLLLSQNDYPYIAPSDVKQYLLWVKDKNTFDIEIAEFIAKAMQLLKIKGHQVILFERPCNTKTPLVHGTFPLIRHIHMWVKN